MSKRKWAAADCETDAFDGRAVNAFVWGYVDSDGDRNIFWDTREFLQWLENFDGIVYAHNGGKFDWLQPEIIPHFNKGNIKLINGRLAKARIGKAELRDSWLCLPAPLAKFGEKDEFDYSILKRELKKDRRKNAGKIEKYLMQDCVALFNAMSRFIETHGFALTQAGAALKYWENEMCGEKRRYGRAHDARFRQYYFGGRCQVFKYGAPIRGDFQLFDINSSYPAAMMNEHCCGTDYVTSTNFKKAHPSSFWSIHAISRGAFCVRDKNGNTIFPDDNNPRDFHVTGWELQAALEMGLVDVISARGLIPRRFESFAPYVKKFFDERKTAKMLGDIIGDVLAKIFMNSLYGKFAANPEMYKDYQLVAAGARIPGWFCSQILPEHDILERPTANPQHFDVAVGASITGYARAALMRGIFRSKNVLYCDTDSVICEEFTGEIGSELGQWKHEADIKAAWIVGKKCYAFELSDGKYKCAHKGINANDITVDDIKRAAAGEKVTIEKSAPNCKLDGSQKFFSRTIQIT